MHLWGRELAPSTPPAVGKVGMQGCPSGKGLGVLCLGISGQEELIEIALAVPVRENTPGTFLGSAGAQGPPLWGVSLLQAGIFNFPLANCENWAHFSTKNPIILMQSPL